MPTAGHNSATGTAQNDKKETISKDQIVGEAYTGGPPSTSGHLTMLMVQTVGTAASQLPFVPGAQDINPQAQQQW